ncbi:two-component regulator propeller domain-containing protein [Arenibacter certesii]|uniref:HTH araC/xylS-type domain-containing protein n=1 Tax=Arenibacter certesii TaxID=228955 RepID=A0A918MPA3_9FLAO|nr:AraC family transcriptional regulator [Arenibacter certesii]GGW46040.1 hypothetical protein GCM10007383_32940 [Arenibacter certesii]
MVHGTDVDHSLRSSFVQSIYEISSDTLWVGTREGIDHVTFTKGYLNPKVVPIESREKALSELRKKYINFIHQDSNNRIWIGTASSGLYLYQRSTGNLDLFSNVDGDSLSIASNAVLSVMEDHSGRMWFGTNTGLSVLQEDEQLGYTFENYKFSKESGEKLPLTNIYAVFQDSKKRIWLGMNGGGLALLKEENNKIVYQRFLHDPKDPYSLSNNEVFVIFEDSQNQIWIGTSEGGLNKLLSDDPISSNHQEYYFERYTEMHGLSDNEINGILEDDAGYLWVANNMGLSKFDIRKEKFTNYTTYDGTLKGKFRKNASWKSKDGTMFFGGTAGINYFNPNTFTENKVLPVPNFSKLTIDGAEITMGQEINGNVVFTSHLSSGKTITLPYSHNRFELKLTAGSYASPYRNQYNYKLEGFDDQWQSISGSDPIIKYSSLPSGDYKLKIMTSNSDGLWNRDPIILDINVKSNSLTANLKWILIPLFLTLTVLLAFKLFSNRNQRKKNNRNLDPLTKLENQRIIEELELIMRTENLYLNPELSLGDLASRIDITPNNLTILLNDFIGKNFYDYVNGYRVEEVKKRLVNPKYKNFTISSIGGDCGFNSKSSFNRVFKKTTGMTPSQFKRNLDAKR